MSESQLFGISTSLDHSSIVIIPVGWDVTTSYGQGANLGPKAVITASPQLDLYDLNFGNISERGIHVLNESEEINKLCSEAAPAARNIIAYHDDYSKEEPLPTELITDLNLTNKNCQSMVDIVYKKSLELLDNTKTVAILGGDHSSPLGLIKAIGEKYSGNFGILHIDAHADLRMSYQGFKHSHASIMYNTLDLQHSPKTLTQVGVRDFCEEEKNIIDNDSRINTYYGSQISSNIYEGKNWNQQCLEIVQSLPQNVYVSFDIDGLSPDLCPNTGTPVPGGLSFPQAEHLFKVLKESKKTVIGFDLCEVAPDPTNNSEWDGNVGARILYKLCGLV